MFHGIRGIAQAWFKSYLGNRQQYVELNGYRSTTLPLPVGVPQGSILGPLLFLLYINDLPSATNLKSVMFADDTNLLIQGKNLDALTASLNSELEGINDYFKANQLKLNAKKTKMVIFRRKALPAGHSQVDVFLDGEKLGIYDEAQFLGVTIDCTLNWERHCNKIANKISCNNSMLNRVKNLLPPPTLKLLYHSFIQSHVTYGLPAWEGCSAQNKKRIVTIQKRAIRTITKSYFSAHTEPRMKKLGLLKFEDLYQQQCLTLTYDCVYQRAPKKIRNLMQSQPTLDYNLRGQNLQSLDLKVPNLKTRAGSNSFAARGPAFWNGIPDETRKIEQRGLFIKTIKKSILEKYEHKSNCNNPRCRDRSHHV